MCGIGWGLSPWGSPWGIGNGWGSAWGEIPWGGCPVPEVPTVPPIELRPGWGRYERVTRYREKPREREYVLNVLFAVHGLHAEAESGRPRIIAGTGASIWLGPLHAQCGLGGATVYAGSWVQATTLPASSDCGEPTVFASCDVNLGEATRSKGKIGSLSVRTIRNPTDEEILMMIAELV